MSDSRSSSRQVVPHLVDHKPVAVKVVVLVVALPSHNDIDEVVPHLVDHKPVAVKVMVLVVALRPSHNDKLLLSSWATVPNFKATSLTAATTNKLTLSLTH
jgi:hypothetical protein